MVEQQNSLPFLYVLLENVKFEDLLKYTEISINNCQNKKLIKRKVNGLL